MSDQQVTFLGEVVDRFITVQYFVSGGGSADASIPVNQRLYEAARDETDDEPLTARAARSLSESIDPGDVVFLSTGFIVPPWNRTEADGPMATPGLARSLALSLEARPIVVTEKTNIEAVEQVLSASGLPVVDADVAAEGHRKVGVTSMPVDKSQEEDRAIKLLDSYDPSAIVAIEKPSRNAAGVPHNGAGFDISATTAEADTLISLARDRNIITVGIGDGGNEIGMGRIKTEIEEILPNMTECKCSCESGITAATETDHLVVGATANWGAYGIEACLAGIANDPKVMHERAMEERIQDATAQAGIVDPMTGLAEGWLDGMPPKASANVVDQLNMTVELQITDPWQMEQWRQWSDRDEELRSAISDYGQRLAMEEND